MRALCGAGLFGAFGIAPAALAADYQGEKVAEFVREMTQDYGFASEQLVEMLAQAERKQAILDAISRPAERVKPWKEYRPIFITDSRVAQGSISGVKTRPRLHAPSRSMACRPR